MSAEITLNFNMYPLIVGQFDKYTFSGWDVEGGMIQLKARLNDSEYTQEDIRWISEDEKVAVVDSTGLVRAMTVGITDICSVLPNGEEARCTIHVIDNIARLTPRSVMLNTERLVLNKLDGAQLHPVFLPVDYFENGMLDKTFTWTSSNPEVAIVDHRGRVFGMDCGKAVITGISNDIGREVSCEIEVIKKKKADLYVDPLEDMETEPVVVDAMTDTKLALPEEVSSQPVCWCSDNAGIVSVDKEGNIRAYRPGNVMVWATFINGGHRIGFPVTVKELPEHAVTEVHLNTYKVNLAIGMETNLYAAVYPATLLEKQLTWASSDETVVRIVRQHINLSGLDEVIVEAVGAGNATIHGTCQGKEVVCHVTVAEEKVLVSSMSLPKQLNLQLEEIRQLHPVINEDATCKDVVWHSDNRDIATVDKDGFVKTYDAGIVTITATAVDESAMSATCTITVAKGQECLSNLRVPVETITDNSICLLWNRKSLMDTDDFHHYEIYVNGQLHARTERISYTVKKLKAETEYRLEVAAVDGKGKELARREVTVTTAAAPTVILDVTKEPYNAKGDGIATDTIAIQRAIDDCPVNGQVVLPAGYVFYSGALFLKSNMTFRIDGILFGSNDPDDYPPIVCRWEGYRKMRLTEENEANTVPVFDENVYSHSSLINAGVYDEGEAGRLSPYHTEHIHICGNGMINGNGFSLSYNQGPCWYIFRKGLPSPQSPKRDQNIRGRVIAIYNAKHVYVSDLTVAYGPSWTIHPVFSDELTFDNLKVISMGNGRTGATEGMITLNGDGIDPDSSTNVNIMGCYFTVGDDAVAIKSGRNRQGYELAKPSAYIRVTDCACVDAKGSFCIGSEQSGGAHDILFQNLYVENLKNFGLWIKSAPCRGGLVEDVLFRDCILKDTGGAMQIEYNHGGDENPSLVLPETRRVAFENIKIQGRNKFAIRIYGVEGSPIHDIQLRGFTFEDFEAYKDRKFYLADCENIDIDFELPEGYEWEKE